MSNITLARPYAKAVFSIAQDSNAIEKWSKALQLLTALVKTSEIKETVENPKLTIENRAELIQALCEKHLDKSIKEQFDAFALMLLDNHRLPLVESITLLFEQFQYEASKTLKAEVTSSVALNDKQQQAIITKLAKLLDRKIVLSVSIDPSILGGFVVKAGDSVIDMSVKGRLEELGKRIAA
jgi:F-type H+-transporting ATPase subunit delta